MEAGTSQVHRTQLGRGLAINRAITESPAVSRHRRFDGFGLMTLAGLGQDRCKPYRGIYSRLTRSQFKRPGRAAGFDQSYSNDTRTIMLDAMLHNDSSSTRRRHAIAVGVGLFPDV